MASTVQSTSLIPESLIQNTSILASSTAQPISPDRSRKRKLEEVITSVDHALAPPEEPEVISRPSKRFHTSRSLYSTLAKYGIGGKNTKAPASAFAPKSETLSKAPHLSAILARTASRTRKAMPFKFAQPAQAVAHSPSTKDFSPSSVPSFLSRLATFKLSTYANKPNQIDAVAAARCGWVNEGKDRLMCGICNASWIVAGREGMSRDAANALVEKQRLHLTSAHRDLCPWKERQCDTSIYRIPLKSPAAMAKDLKIRSLSLESMLQNVKIQHPLTLSQIHALTSTLSSVDASNGPTLDLSAAVTEAASAPSDGSSASTPMPSESAIITALFGWTIAPSNPPAERPSHSRAQSLQPQTPSISRSPSVSSISSSRASTPGPSTASHRLSLSGLRRISATKQLEKKAEATMVHCALCQRKIGLWTFTTPPRTEPVATQATEPAANQAAEPAATQTPPPPGTPSVSSDAARPAPARPQRVFDVLKEHRAYCPYVVRSTSVPSFPAARPAGGHARTASAPAETDGEAMEGWRAVLSVVCRYRLAQRQMGRTRSVSASSRIAGGAGAAPGSLGAEPSGDAMEVDNVGAMVNRVKARGGKELLKYVKSLLG